MSFGIREVDRWANAPAAEPRVQRLAANATAPAPVGTPAPEPLEVTSSPTPRLASRAVEPRAPAQPSKSPKPLKPLLAGFGAPEPRRELRQEEYKLAKDAYDANERAEGYRWAQQYRVRTRRYCRDLERQRTAAFMEGCLQYAAGTKPRDAAGTSGEGPG